MPKSDKEIAQQYTIACPGHDFYAFCQQAYALSNKFKCHSCSPEAAAAHNGITGYGEPRYRLRGLDSSQQAFDFAGPDMLEVLIAFARQMATRYAKRMQAQSDHLNTLLDKRAAA